MSNRTQNFQWKKINFPDLKIYSGSVFRSHLLAGGGDREEEGEGEEEEEPSISVIPVMAASYQQQEEEEEDIDRRWKSQT